MVEISDKLKKALEDDLFAVMGGIKSVVPLHWIRCSFCGKSYPPDELREGLSTKGRDFDTGQQREFETAICGRCALSISKGFKVTNPGGRSA